MGIRKQYRELDSLASIQRSQSPRAAARAAYIQEKKSGGCLLCGGHDRLAFYHKDPSSKSFDVQKCGIMISEEKLEEEIQKCVVLCVSCRMRILGSYRPPATITNKGLFWELREKYQGANPTELPKNKTKNSSRLKGPTRAQYPRETSYKIPESVRQTVFKRDANLCGYCYDPATEIDHLIPWSFGGSDDPDNLVACCGPCNRVAYSMVFSSFEEKREYIRKRRKIDQKKQEAKLRLY